MHVLRASGILREMLFIVVRHVSRAYLILREIPFIFVCLSLRNVSNFRGTACCRRVSMFEERVAVSEKCVSWLCAMCFKNVGHFTGMPLIVVSLCLKSF